MLALEPRIMYDAAAVLGFADAVDNSKPEVPPGQNGRTTTRSIFVK